MIGLNIQGFNIAPREGRDPRVAKTDSTQFRTGNDGKHYRMLDRKEWSKYHVLSDDDLAEETLRSLEIKENMMTMQGKIKNGHLTRKSASGIRVTTPQVGTASSTRRKDTMKWEKELDTAAHTGKTLKGSSFQSTIAKLAANTQQEEDEDEEEEQESSPVYEYSNLASNDKTKQAFEIIQQKYEQNLHVVDKLYQEKISLEEYTKALEVELMKAKGMISKKTPTRYPPPSSTQELLLDIPSRQDDNDQHYNEDEFHDEDMEHIERMPPTKPSHYEPSVQRQKKKKPSQGVKLSAAEAAALFASKGSPPSSSSSSLRRRPTKYQDIEVAEELEEEEEEEEVFQRARSATRSRPRSASTSRHHLANSKSQTSLRSSSIPPAWRHSYRADSSHRSTSPASISSTPQPTRKVTGLSLQLQADQDRYLQKRKLLAQQEAQKQQTQAAYEEYLHARQQRASKNGTAFTSMEERQYQALKAQEEKEKLKKAKERDAKRKLKAQQDALEHKKLQTMKDALYAHNALSWRELQEQTEAERKERIERRKQELLATSSLPPNMQEHMHTQQLKKTLSESKLLAQERMKTVPTFQAEDPEKVTERLQKQRSLWEQKMALEKAKSLETQMLNTGSATTTPRSLTPNSSTHRGVRTSTTGAVREKTTLEKRHEEYLRKRQEKQREKQEREEAEKRKQEEQERKKFEHLLHSKVPIDSAFKTTKATKLKQQQLEKAKQAEMKAKEQQAKRLQEKALAAKETSAVMKYLVKERIEELKTKNPNYLELTATEKLARERSRQEKLEYQNKLLANQQKLEESLKNRPSLLERHDKSIAMQQATAAGLMKIAQVLDSQKQLGDDEFGLGNISDSSDEERNQKGKQAQKSKKSSGGVSGTTVKKMKDDLFDEKEKGVLGI